MDLHFAWQVWRLWHWLALVARLVLCAAGVALGDIGRHFAWQAWHLWHWAGPGGALGSRLLPWSPWLFVWQVWRLETSTFTLRGSRGTWWHRPSLRVAGVALMALVWFWWLLSHTRTHTTLSHTQLSHTTLSHISFTHNFVTHNFVTQTLPHNFVTDSFHTQLCHTTLSHTILSHATLSHTTLSHTSLSHTQLFYTHVCHIHLFHTQYFTHNFVTYNSYTHKLIHTHTQNTVTHSSFTQPVLHHRLSFLPFPSHFHICLVIIGKNWHVGLSGPLILWDIADKQTKSCAEECAKVLWGRLHGEAIVKVLQALVNVLAFPNLAQAILDPARLIPSHSCAFWGATRQSCQSHAASIIFAGLDMKIILVNQQQFVFRSDQAFHLSTESLHI